MQERAVFRARALGNHLDLDGFLAFVEIDMDDRDARAARRLLVLAGDRVDHRGAQRMLAGGAFATAPDRRLERDAVELDMASDRHVVDRDAGVLAEQIIGALGDRDVLDHGVEHGAADRIGFAPDQRFEAGLDVGRQELEGAHVERLAQLLDFARVDLHRHLMRR